MYYLGVTFSISVASDYRVQCPWGQYLGHLRFFFSFCFYFSFMESFVFEQNVLFRDDFLDLCDFGL